MTGTFAVLVGKPTKKSQGGMSQLRDNWAEKGNARNTRVILLPFLPILKDFLGHVGRISSRPGTAGEAMYEVVGVRSCSSEEVSQVIDPQRMSRLSWGTCAYRGKDKTLCWPNKFSPGLTHSTEN